MQSRSIDITDIVKIWLYFFRDLEIFRTINHLDEDDVTYRLRLHVISFFVSEEHWGLPRVGRAATNSSRQRGTIGLKQEGTASTTWRHKVQDAGAV